MGDGCQHQPMCACANEVERLRSALEAAEREREEFRDLYNAAWNRASLAEATVERLTRERDRMLDEAAKSERRVCIERDAARAEVERLTRERDEARKASNVNWNRQQGWATDEARARAEEAESALAAARAEAGALREAAMAVLRTHGHSNPDTDCAACGDFHRAGGRVT